MAGELTLRFQRGEVVVELRGDADAVQTTFADLQASGLGALTGFFGLPVSPGQPIVLPGPTPPLINPAASFRFVFDSLNLPIKEPFSADDVDGDGRPDNGFANIIGALESLSLDLQGQIDSELHDGQLILLLTVATELATPAPDQQVAVTLLAGQPVKHAEHVYLIDPSVSALTVQGRIVAGRFLSDDPRTGGVVVQRDVRLPIGPSAHATLRVQGLRLAFDISVDGSAISNGQLTGSMKQDDVRNGLVPAFAAMMTGLIQADPTSATAQSIQKLFDAGGCTNPDGTQSQAGDGVIDICELATNPLMISLLQPDVQIYDAKGSYAPNPLGGNRDSTSIGLGFSATAASY